MIKAGIQDEIHGATEHRGCSPFGEGPREVLKGTDGDFKILGMNRNSAK